MTGQHLREVIYMLLHINKFHMEKILNIKNKSKQTKCNQIFIKILEERFLF